MVPKIIEGYSEAGVDVGRIVKRIVSYLPENITEGLKEINLLDQNIEHPSFGCYRAKESIIEIYVKDILEWQPYILKKTYLVPYITVGLALGHELDHHVNRNNKVIDKEKHAEGNAFKYVYPSLGIFKPIIRILIFIVGRNNNKK
jgi:hypothetical protein